MYPQGVHPAGENGPSAEENARLAKLFNLDFAQGQAFVINQAPKFTWHWCIILPCCFMGGLDIGQGLVLTILSLFH